MTDGGLILYTTDDGTAQIQLQAIGGTAWLTQEQMAKLFDRERSVITKHIGNVFADGELAEESNVQNVHIAQRHTSEGVNDLDELKHIAGTAGAIKTKRPAPKKDRGK